MIKFYKYEYISRSSTNKYPFSLFYIINWTSFVWKSENDRSLGDVFVLWLECWVVVLVTKLLPSDESAI